VEREWKEENQETEKKRKEKERKKGTVPLLVMRDEVFQGIIRLLELGGQNIKAIPLLALHQETKKNQKEARIQD